MSSKKKNNKNPNPTHNAKKDNKNDANSSEDNDDDLNKSGSDMDVSINRFALKITFVGDSYVGKTSVISRFIDKDFDIEKPCTVSASYQVKKLKIDPFNQADLKIWDTAGSEKYRSMTKNYLRGSNGIVIVFDLTSQSSFNNVDLWMNDLKDVVDDKAVKILAGNKCDLRGRKITNEEANKYAKDHDMRYLEISAKEGINIESLFEILATHCIRKLKEKQKQNEEEGLNNDPTFGSKTGNLKIDMHENKKKKGSHSKKCC